MKKMIKAIPLILILTVMLLTSCSDNGSGSGAANEHGSPMQDEIMDCFKADDRQELKRLMSKYVRENDKELESQINEAFDFIDGDIKSYGDTKTETKGDDDNKQYSACTKRVTTFNGKEYDISFEGWYKCKSDPTKEGIMLITVTDTSVKAESGSSDKENGIYSIGIKE